VESNLTEIAASLAKSLEPFNAELTKLADAMKQQLEGNPELAKQYAEALKDADLKKKFDDLQKELKNINHTFRK